MSNKGLVEIEVGRIVPSPTNPRKDFAEGALQELAESIRDQGVLQPLILIQREGEFVFELVCGERRWRAAQLAGLGTVPCLVKELSKQQIIEIQWIENLQRNDLTPLDEALGLAGLMAEGWTVEKLCERFKKKRSTIFNRLKLAKLEGVVREALKAGKIDATLAGLLASLPASAQEAALKKVAEGYYADGEPMSFREAKRYIDQNFDASLEDVPWDLEDKKLFKEAGSCAKCPKRSGNLPEEEQKELRAGGSEDGPNVCTDLSCRQEKLNRFRAARLEEQAAKGERVATVEECDRAFAGSGGEYLGNRSGYIDLNETLRFSDGKWHGLNEKLRKPKSKPVVLVNAKGKVYRRYVEKEIEQEMKESGIELWDPKKHSENNGKESGRKAGETQAEFKLRVEEDKRQAELKEKIEQETLNRCGEKVLEKLKGPKEEDRVWRLVAKYLAAGDANREVNKRFGVKSYNGDELAKLKEPKLREYVIEQMLGQDQWQDDSRFEEGIVKELCGEFGIDRKKIGKDVAAELKAEAEGKGRTKYLWRIEYEHKGKTYTTVEESSMERSEAEMLGEFKTRHKIDGKKATLAGKKEGLVVRGKLPHEEKAAKAPKSVKKKGGKK
jgi:ParB/RepB/Spo0J family partition protein